MPGYSFQVAMTLRNPTTKEQVVSIPRGTMIEPESTHLSFQSAVVARDYVFRLNPKETRSVILDVECWNKNLAPPHGVPGKITPLKGNIKKTTKIWAASSTPSGKTVLTKPSQDAHVFSAFAHTSPDLAYKFLNEVVTAAESEGVDVEDIVEELEAISDLSTGRGKDELCRIARETDLYPYVKANAIRSFFITHNGSTAVNADAVERLLTSIYAHTSHRLVSRLYEVAAELRDLTEDLKIAVTKKRRKEFKKLVRQKYIDLLDALPLLDEIEWE